MEVMIKSTVNRTVVRPVGHTCGEANSSRCTADHSKSFSFVLYDPSVRKVY